jgi:hypothetical protein
MGSVEEGSIPHVGQVVIWERLHAHFLDIKQDLVNSVAKLHCIDNERFFFYPGGEIVESLDSLSGLAVRKP